LFQATCSSLNICSENGVACEIYCWLSFALQCFQTQEKCTSKRISAVVLMSQAYIWTVALFTVQRSTPEKFVDVTINFLDHFNNVLQTHPRSHQHKAIGRLKRNLHQNLRKLQNNLIKFLRVQVSQKVLFGLFWLVVKRLRRLFFECSHLRFLLSRFR